MIAFTAEKILILQMLDSLCLMDQICFKNFRRFSDFTTLELGRLNILVGTNNSGKSSAIKACILAQMAINQIHGGEIPLDNISFREVSDAHLHLGDFLSNLSNGSTSREMDFAVVCGKTSVHFIIDGSNLKSGDPSLLVPLKILEFKNETMDASIKYEFYFDGKTKISLSTSSDRILQFLFSEAERDQWRNHSTADNAFEQEAERVFVESSPGYIYNTCKGKYSGETRTVNFSWEPYGDYNYSLSSHISEPFDDCRELLLFYQKVRKCISLDLRCARIQYIEAHNAPHNEFLYEEDKNNYLAQTVAKFISSPAADNSTKRAFILKWMKELSIGEDYRITRPFPEVLKVDILNGERWESLGKMGTGTVQLYILLLRLAMAEDCMLFIEEPEQNLHPALQSKLADMFFEYSQDSRVQVFVETHSEYMVRKTQVIIANMIATGADSTDALNKVYKVYYFPSDAKAPYSLEYLSNGQFSRKFGTGFYDEADKNYLALLKEL